MWIRARGVLPFTEAPPIDGLNVLQKPSEQHFKKGSAAVKWIRRHVRMLNSSKIKPQMFPKETVESVFSLKSCYVDAHICVFFNEKTNMADKY